MRCFLRTRIATLPAGSPPCAGGGSSARANRCPCTPSGRRSPRSCGAPNGSTIAASCPYPAGGRHRLGGCTIRPLTVPHARERRFPTFAWRLTAGGRTLVYASDVARLTGELERFARGAGLLVIDGAMWRRRIFSHLTIDAALPVLCGWRVDRIALTQIGKTAPAHEWLTRAVKRTC